MEKSLTTRIGDYESAALTAELQAPEYSVVNHLWYQENLLTGRYWIRTSDLTGVIRAL